MRAMCSAIATLLVLLAPNPTRAQLRVSEAAEPGELVHVRAFVKQPVAIEILSGPNAVGNTALPVALEVRNTSPHVLERASFIVIFPDVTERGMVYGLSIGFDAKYGAKNIVVAGPVAPGATVRIPIAPEEYETLASYLDQTAQPLSCVKRAVVMAQVVVTADGTTWQAGAYDRE